MTTTPPLSRRDALKLGGLALGSLVTSFAGSPFRPLPPGDLPTTGTVYICRVSVPAILAYTEPRFNADRTARLYRDKLLTIWEEISSPDGPAHNPIWYRTVYGYIHSGRVQKIQVLPPNPPVTSIPETGAVTQVTAPYTRSYVYAKSGGWQPVYRLYYDSVHWVTAVVDGPDGSAWYRIQEHFPEYTYYAPAGDLRVISPEEYAPISSAVNPKDKRIEIDIAAQRLTAYEGNLAVFTTLVASGLPSPENLPAGEIPTETPLGSFWVQTKMPSRHMGDGKLTSDINAYELPGVPWTMLFHEDGVALHGAYWHNNFGTRMSHGCVNLRSSDALWLFRWTDPVFDPTQWYTRQTGTLVHVS